MANSLDESQAAVRPYLGPTTTLLVVGAGAFLGTLDLFIVNIAFPHIRADFPGTSTAGLSWMVNAYGIVFAALLVPAGRMADLLGRRRLFRLGMLVFALSSAGCAASPSVAVLVACRAAQAVGAALMVPTSLGLLLAAYPERHHGRVVAAWAAIGSVAAAAGPPLGGLLVQSDWRWIFLINVPVAALAVFLSRRLAERRHVDDAGLPDFAGAVLLAVAVGAVVAALANASEWGAGSGLLWICVVAGIAGFGLFLWRCASHPRPVVDLTLLRVPQFSLALLALTLFYAGFGALLLGASLFLTQVWRQGSVTAGAELATGPLAAGASAVISARLNVDRRRLAILGGIAFALAGGWWLLAMDGTPAFAAHYLPGSLLSGTGVGLSQAALISSGAAALPASRYATGTGILNMSRQVGSAIGVAVLVAAIGSGSTTADFHPAWIFMAACGLLAAMASVALARLRPRQTPGD